MSMMMIQITSKTKETLADMTEKILHYAGKLMSCVESMDEGSMGERSYRHMGMRDMDEDMDMPERDYGNRWEAYGDRMPNRYGNRRYR